MNYESRQAQWRQPTHTSYFIPHTSYLKPSFRAERSEVEESPAIPCSPSQTLCVGEQISPLRALILRTLRSK